MQLARLTQGSSIAEFPETDLPRAPGQKMREKIPCMPLQNVVHVLYAMKNINLSFMPKVAIFHVLYAISVRCSWMPSAGR
jgi:hypothetical protein